MSSDCVHHFLPQSVEMASPPISPPYSAFSDQDVSILEKNIFMSSNDSGKKNRIFSVEEQLLDQKLIELEKDSVSILAFSIGGAIAWKYGLKSQKIDSLICVSSTRLRKEVEKPKGKIALYFGEDDAFKPKREWFHNMELNPKEGKHQLTLVDEEGNRLTQDFEIIGKE